MYNWLFVDLSGFFGVIGVSNIVFLVSRRVLLKELYYGSVFSNAVLDCIIDAKIGICEINGVVIGIGPGLSSGIRISVLEARGIGCVLGIPVLGLCNFSRLVICQNFFLKNGILVSFRKKNKCFLVDSYSMFFQIYSVFNIHSFLIRYDGIFYRNFVYDKYDLYKCDFNLYRAWLFFRYSLYRKTIIIKPLFSLLFSQ